MASLRDRLSRLGTRPRRSSPMKEVGVTGTPVVRGFVRDNEINPSLRGQARYRTASDLLTNVSIIAAGIRYFLDLVAKPSWTLEPADDSDQAMEVADFMEDVINDMKTSWARMIRRSGMYRFHGFGIQEWTAKNREDGRIGLLDIEPRPQHTIWQWDVEPNGDILGVVQRSPQDGTEIYLPREKIVYLVDDLITDSPEGSGWFRALAEPASRFKQYRKLERIAFERNLAGTPVGRVPYSELNRAVQDAVITQEEMDRMVAGMERFVDLQVKEPSTSLLIDSIPYHNETEDGVEFTDVAKWSVELLEGNMDGIEPLAGAIDREIVAMARIIGVEQMLIGADGAGSLALDKSKSNNLYLVVNSTLGDMAEGFDRDVIKPVGALNGIPDEMLPTLKAEDVAFKDVEQISAMIRDIAVAGVPLEIGDPAVNDLRSLAGVPEIPEEMIEDQIRARDEAREALRPPTEGPGSNVPPEEDE